MTEVRGIKRIGPKPKFAPIRAMSDEKRPVAFFEDVHVKEGTTNDRLHPWWDPAGNQHVHHPEASGGRAPSSGRGRAWTDEEDTQIIVMVKGGHTIQEIADEIDRSWDATQKRVTRLRKVYGLPYSTRKGRHK
ncbi:MAG TPA: hypothetical protein DEV97_00990 [Lachnospiraceae bacterium]|nr:hypothetical protein [Lachnospiraceae bacterium]